MKTSSDQAPQKFCGSKAALPANPYLPTKSTMIWSTDDSVGGLGFRMCAKVGQCPYEQCPGGVMVSGAEYAPANGHYKQTEESCQDVEAKGRGHQKAKFWSNDNGAQIAWSWGREEAEDKWGWGVIHDGLHRYIDAEKRNSPLSFVTDNWEPVGDKSGDAIPTVECLQEEPGTVPATPECPAEQPLGGQCSGSLTCHYGEVSCCGEVHHELTASCIGGRWMMTYTDLICPEYCDNHDGEMCHEAVYSTWDDQCCHFADSEESTCQDGYMKTNSEVHFGYYECWQCVPIRDMRNRRLEDSAQLLAPASAPQEIEAPTLRP